MHRNFLIFILIISAISLLLGLYNNINGNFSGIALPFVPLEIFIWGDTLIISPFLIVSSIYLIKKNNHIYTGLLFSLYYSIRSFIEIIYDVFAQFSTTSRSWETNWEKFDIVIRLGKPEVHVLSQLFFTIVTLISFLFFIKYLKLYFHST